MKRLYLLVVFACAIAGSVLAQAPTSFETTKPERTDISKSVNIFPNPATEWVHVRLEHVNVDKVHVSMHNIIGNEINIETERIDDHELRVRVKDFDAGYYLLALKDEQSNFRGTYKFLKR